MGELGAFVQKHPVAIFAAVAVVALIAYMQSSGGSSSGGDVSFVGGGVAPTPIDPGVTAIDQARIQAGTTNLSTLAQLILGQQESTDAFNANEHQTDAALTANLASTSAALTSSLAATAASRDTSLAATQASVTENATNANAATIVAGYTAQAQAAISAANVQAAQLAHDTEQTQLQFQKDTARAADNTSIVNGIVSVVGEAISFLSFGLF